MQVNLLDYENLYEIKDYNVQMFDLKDYWIPSQTPEGKIIYAIIPVDIRESI